jgi:hypothetical protein
VLLTAVKEQIMNIKACFKLGKTPKETYEMFQTDCGDESLSRSSESECLNDLKTGLTTLRMI